jgi:hypothetical protein
MKDKQIIPHGMDLDQIPVDNSLAIVPVEDPLPLAVIPPKPLAPAKPRSYERAYIAQVHAPTIEGIRSHPSKVKFLPPKEAPQKAPPQERWKRQRTIVASLEEQVKFLIELVKSLDKDHKLVSRLMTTTNERIDLECIEHKKLEAKVESLASDVRGDGKEKK